MADLLVDADVLSLYTARQQAVLNQSALGVQPLSPELWMSVFAALPFVDVHNVTLACRSFCWLAQHLLFRALSVRPYRLIAEPVSLGVQYVPLDNDDERKVLAEKFCFWSSPRIAHGIRRCDIALPFQPTIQDPSHSKAAILFFDAVVRTFIATLTACLNVRDVKLTGVTLIPYHFDQLATLPSLESIVLHCCRIDGVPAVLPPVKARRVCLDMQGGVETKVMLQSSQPAVYQLLCTSLLHPSHLTALSIDVPALLPILVRMGPWPNMTDVKIALCQPSMPSLVPFLLQCPQLKTLDLGVNFAQTFVDPILQLPDGALQQLHTYTGPVDSILNAIGGGRTILHLTLLSIEQFDQLTVARAVAEASEFCKELLTLEMDTNISYYPSDILQSLADSSPKLKTLKISGREMYDDEDLPASFSEIWAEILAAKLPASLERFWIRIPCGNECASWDIGEEPDESVDIVAAGQSLVDAWGHLCPTLRYVSLQLGKNLVEIDFTNQGNNSRREEV